MVVYSLSGANGQLYIYEDYLEICRKGMLARLSHLDADVTVIYYDEIAQVKLHMGTPLYSGYFFFKRKNTDKSCNLIDAVRDEDCIVFRFYENEKAKLIKKYINNLKKVGL